VFTVLFEPRDRVTLTRYSGLLSPEDRKPRMNPGQDRVFVAPQQEIREICRDYAQVQRDFGNGEMMVVQTMAEALLLLGLHNPDFQHLWRPTSPAGSFLPPG